jgi:hypothetical protein
MDKNPRIWNEVYPKINDNWNSGQLYLTEVKNPGINRRIIIAGSAHISTDPAVDHFRFPWNVFTQDHPGAFFPGICKPPF